MELNRTGIAPHSSFDGRSSKGSYLLSELSPWRELGALQIRQRTPAASSRVTTVGAMSPVVGRRPGYSTVAHAVYASLPSYIAARSHYGEVIAPVHLIYGEKDWSRPSDRQADRQLLPDAEYTQVPGAGHFITLERPDVLANALNAMA